GFRVPRVLEYLPLATQATRNKLPLPVNLNLTSVSFIHMLTWEPGPGTPAGVHYNVTVCTETGTSWAPVAGCERVQSPLVCNLTQAFWDREVVYIAQVTAQLDTWEHASASHKWFKPIRDTHLALPMLTVTPCGRELCVDLQPPVENLRKVYESLQYKFQIRTNGSTMFLRRTRLENLAPGREYCVSVCISDSLMHRTSSYSQPVCAVAPGDNNGLMVPALVFVVLIVVAVMLGVVSRKCVFSPLCQTSVHHIDDVLVFHCSSLTSLLKVHAATPSAGNQQTVPDDSDEETVTESTAGSGEGGYKLKLGSNPLSSSSSLPSCLLTPLDAPTASEADPPPADCLSGGAVQKEEQVGEGGSQDVNLLTLTFGMHREEEEEDKSHDEPTSASKDITPNLPAATWSTEEEEMVSCPVQEEEEEEESGYIGRPSAQHLQNFM
uniref:Fibronectin type-III domain-containing protein n=1 Tax=Mola mola TaxID=94237 RepID=A0A3Q3XGL3_MOLML